MATKSTNNFNNFDFTGAFDQFKASPFDLKSVLESHRKNVQALTQAQQVTMENVQALAQRQTEILSQIVEDHSALVKEFLNEGTPEDKIAKNADLYKKIYERTIKNMNDLSEMINKSNSEASDIINKRVSASISEIKSALDKKDKKAA